ncbi:MAG: DUF2630 family protein [Trebonia sp.]
MDDKDIMSKITDLIDAEHELRGQLQRGELSTEQERERLRSTEEALDQCWDLLRQRRAKREFGESTEGANARPVSEVEGYQQLSLGGTPVPRARAAAFLSSVSRKVGSNATASKGASCVSRGSPRATVWPMAWLKVRAGNR